jgi:hypothetical protein
MKILIIMILLATIVECGRKDYGSLDPVARSFGQACDFGDPMAITAQCGPLPNDCGSSVNGSIDNVEKELQSSSIFCTRWCVDSCPSGTFCPNPDHGRLEDLTSGFCYRPCERDSDCADKSICDFKMGEGACIPSCTFGYTTCDQESSCLSNGHCSN